MITTNFPATIALFNANSGDFPFAEKSSQLSMRVDHSFADGHQAFIRLNGTRDTNDNAQFGSLIGYSRGRSFSDWNGTVVAGDSWAIGPRTLSQTRIGFGYDGLDVNPNDPNGPGIEIQGFGIFGRDTFLPARSLERHYQLDQTFAWDTGKHLFKVGVSINPVQNVSVSPAFFAGTFSFAADIPLATVLDLATGNPGFDSALGSTLTSLRQPGLAASLQQPISALQAFNLGLPTYYQQGFGDPVWRGWTNRYGVFGQDSWRVTPALTLNVGLRYELETKNKNVPTDYHNFAPRFGFAWSPAAAKGGLVVRGGYGIFYGKIDAAVSFIADKFSGNEISTVLVPITGLPGVNNPATGQPLTSIDIYNTLAAEGILGTRPILASDLKQFGVTPGPNLPFALLVGVDPHFVNPYAEQASLEIERQWHGFALSAAYNFTRGLHLLRALDRNLYLAGRTPDGHPIYGFYNPEILQRNVFESTANSEYNAMILRVGRRFQRHFMLDAHYTWSKSIDEVTDYALDYEPNDQLNPGAEKALSSFNQSHRLVVFGSFDRTAPLKGASVLSRVLGDSSFSPIFIAHSGTPFNLLTGFDSAGDNHPTTHRPWGAGRNIGKGPDFVTADFRYTRRIPIKMREGAALEMTAECFNSLNRTNFRSVNNTVGNVALSQLPNPIVGNRGNPVDPLSFTSAFDGRQFQFGLRAKF